MIFIGKLYSKEQVERAKSVNLADYLIHRGEKLKRSGSEYKYIYRDSSGEHDSVMIRDNKWYDFKNQQGGDTIGFLQVFMGFSFRQAVEELLNGEQAEDLSKNKKQDLNIVLPQKEKDFILPEPNDNMNRLFAYLVKSRFIDAKIVQHFVDSKSIYQEKEHGNIVFLGIDKQGVIRSAQKTGTNTYKPKFKCSVSGSNMEYGFNHIGNDNSLFVFESPIDLMSYVTIYPENWKEHSYIALDGLSPKAMFLFLKENENISIVNICVDYDEAGIEAYDKFKDMLIEKGYKAENIKRIYPVYKDWNEMLKAEAGCKPIPAKEHPKIQEYENVINFLEDICDETQNYVEWKYKKYNEQGIEFVLNELNKVFAEFQNEIYKEKIIQFKTQNIDKPKLDMLSMADLCISVVSFIKSKELSIENQRIFYKNNLKELLDNYKPYKDKEKFRTRVDEITKEYLMLKNTLISTDDENKIKNTLKSYADLCIKMNIYIELSYEMDLSMSLNLINRNAQEFTKEQNINVGMF